MAIPFKSIVEFEDDVVIQSDGNLIIESLDTGVSDDILIIDPNGKVEKRTLSSLTPTLEEVLIAGNWGNRSIGLQDDTPIGVSMTVENIYSPTQYSARMYAGPFGSNISLDGGQDFIWQLNSTSINNVATLEDNFIRTTVDPVHGDDLVRKSYVDNLVSLVPTPNLQQVLTVGNSASTSINLNSSSSEVNYWVGNSGTTGFVKMFANSGTGELGLQFSSVSGGGVKTISPVYFENALELNAGQQFRVYQNPVNANDLARKAYVDSLVYTHPTQTAITVTATGVEVMSNITVNTLGHTTAFTKRTLPTASDSVTGVLSSANWTTFNNKQAALVSGTNIKTINGVSVLGSGDMTVGGVDIKNAVGVSQWFTSDVNPDIRFAGSGDTTISFNATTRTITINSTPGSGTGGAVTSFNSRTGGVVSEVGDYNLDMMGDVNLTSLSNLQILQYDSSITKWKNVTLNTSIVPEGTNQYFTQARARQSISLTTTGGSGASTYNNSTGIFNIPNYTLSGLGGQPLNSVLTSIGGLTTGTGLLKLTSGVASLDTNTYALNSSLGNYVLKSGDTMTGTLNGTQVTMSGNISTTNSGGNGHFIRLENASTYTRLNFGITGQILFQLQNATNGTMYFSQYDGSSIVVRQTFDVFGNILLSPVDRVHVTGDVRVSNQLISQVAVGTAPLVVTSTTLVTNLNSDLLDGEHGSYYLNRVNHIGVQPISSITNLQTTLDGKQPNIVLSSQKLMGRYSTGSGSYEEISIGSGLSLSGAGVLTATGTVNNGTLTLGVGTGLTGSASFTANQAGNSTFTVGVDTSYFDGRYVNVNGDTMTGTLNMNGAGIVITPSSGIKTFLSFINPNGTGSSYFDSYIVQESNNLIHWYSTNGSTAGELELGFSDVYINGESIATKQFVLDNSYVHPNSGVTPSTYNNVTVNAQGHVTSGSNVSYLVPSDLANYVTTNTDQSGIAGNKQWTGHHRFTPSNNTALTPVANSVRITRSSDITQIMIDGNDGTAGLVLYGAPSGAGAQLWLKSGSIQATPPEYSSGGFQVLVRNNSTALWERKTLQTSDISGLQSNYVSTNTDQLSGLTGHKYWNGTHRFLPTVEAAPTANSVSINHLGGTGTSIRGYNSSNVQAYILRNYATSGVQMELAQGGIKALANAYTTGGYSVLARNNTTGIFETVTNPDRFIAYSSLDLNTAINGGVFTWVTTSENPPVASTYGTGITFVGGSTTGNGNPSNSWINQLMATTGNDWFIRQSINNSSNWTSSYKIWTEKQFTQTNINSWNAIAAGSYVNTTGAQTGLAGNKTWTGAHSFSGNNITISSDNTGVVFNGGGMVYKRSGGGITIRRHNDVSDVVIENAAATERYRIFSENWSLFKGNSTNWNSGDVQDLGDKSTLAYANSSGITGTPESSNSYILHLTHPNNSTVWMQLGVPYGNNTKVYVRQNNAGTIRPWSALAYESWVTTNFVSSSVLTGYVPTSRTVSAGTGLTGGGALSGNISLAVNFGTAAGTVSQGNHNHDGSYVPLTRGLQFQTSTPSALSITGTSSTNLSVDRTVNYSVNFGTGSGQVAEGNHGHHIHNLSGVAVSSPSSGQVLKWNGSNWVNQSEGGGGSWVPTSRQMSFQTSTPGALSIGGTPTTYLDQDRTINYSVNFGTGSGQVAEGNHNHHIHNLNGVSVSSPGNGQVLKWNGSNWTNQNDNTGESSVSWNITEDALSWRDNSNTTILFRVTSMSIFIKYGSQPWREVEFTF